MKIILFDIDGTLLYTGGSGRIAFEKAFEELFGLQEVWQDLIPDGKTDPMIISEIVARTLSRALSADEYVRLMNRYHDFFEIEILNPPKFQILPGVPGLLEKLSQQSDVLLGVATGNYEQAAWAKLRKGNLQTHFRFGGFGSDHENRTELTRIGLERGEKILGRKARRDQVFLIGDTPHDVRVGKELGVKTIAVATGRTSSNEFKEKFKPEYVLEDLSRHDLFLEILQSS